MGDPPSKSVDTPGSNTCHSADGAAPQEMQTRGGHRAGCLAWGGGGGVDGAGAAPTVPMVGPLLSNLLGSKLNALYMLHTLIAIYVQ